MHSLPSTGPPGPLRRVGSGAGPLGAVLGRRSALALGATAFAAAVGLAGCSSTLPAADVSAPGFASRPSGTIRFWCRSVAFAPAQMLVERYHASQSAVRVELTVLPEGQMVTKLATAIRANSVPDVVAPDSVTTPVFSSREALTDLTPLIDALPYADRLNRPLLDVGSYDGRAYGLPALSNVSQLFWNKPLYERAGLDPESGPTDFAQYLAHARALAELDGVSGVTFTGNSAGILGYVVQPHFWAEQSPFFIGRPGEQTADVADNAALRATLDLYGTFYRDGLAQPGVSADSGASWGSDFLAGEVGLFPGSLDLILGGGPEQSFLDDLGVSPFPGPEGASSQFSGGAVLSIPRGAQNPEAAWDFMRFVADLEQQLELASLGWYPVRDDVLDTDFPERFPLMVPGMRGMNDGFAAPTTLYTQLVNAVQSPWLAMFREGVFGSGDLDAVLARGQAETARVLEVNQA